MEKRLGELISRYQAAVASAVAALEESGIRKPISSREWIRDRSPERGELRGGGTYFKHGCGCTVMMKKLSVNFDFGDSGQTDGFHPGRLWDFAKQHVGTLGFKSFDDVSESLRHACASGEVRHSEVILHYLA
jgi:hypothetical protein